jgi:hypothetical protein
MILFILHKIRQVRVGPFSTKSMPCHTSLKWLQQNTDGSKIHFSAFYFAVLEIRRFRNFISLIDFVG